MFVSLVQKQYCYFLRDDALNVMSLGFCDNTYIVQVGRYCLCRYQYDMDISYQNIRDIDIDILYCSGLWPANIFHYRRFGLVERDVTTYLIAK